MILIPAIDLMNGKCVRLFQGDPSKSKQYYEDPTQASRLFQAQGAEILHVVDLDSALGLGENIDTIEKIIKSVDIRIQVGGGIRTFKKAEKILELGATRAIFGTAFIRNPALITQISETFGKQRVAGAIDVKDGKLAIEGWKSKTELGYIEVAKRLVELGVGAIIFTSVNADGTLKGPALNDTKRLVQSLDIPIIASGGIKDLEDLHELALIDVEGVIIGTALYENKFTLREALEVVKNAC
ncbi:1-(5-phosphoribosyl)-5-[(5-phosphoribosylamino)methylideneamino]imidazole-4-carboxamide isomerase [Candidatus Bathyarchaeota archaeon]|jgi:phosphoribosylformimino-5-aminoimidazole carboxamide ribotide isomerase|nr:1-(5-phosphoribosyl)-5-[(5-phosphoribosylamino)methylideneamino]imidazole-4-carboxamide isomerase [Candidatus Bathyarchaeota archaeon]